MTLDNTFYKLPFEQEVEAAPVSSKFSLSHNIIITLRINYTIIIMICINNNAVINNNYGKL